MKKLNELSINPEKVITNEVLVNLRGGNPNPCGGGFTCWCSVTYDPNRGFIQGYICGAEDFNDCQNQFAQLLLPGAMDAGCSTQY